MNQALLLFVVFLICGPPTVEAQYADATGDKYGLDPLLYNGSYYTYFISSGTLSHPYYLGPGFMTGTARVHDQSYENLYLKYDLLNQQVILQYKEEDGGVKHIILSDAWLEAFDLGNAHFEVRTAPDSLKHIYQVVGVGPIHILYHWTKELKLDMRPGAHNYFFTPPNRKMFLLNGDLMSRYSNTKSLITLLDYKLQARAKKYLSRKKINVKKADDLTMSDFITYLNTISH